MPEYPSDVAELLQLSPRSRAVMYMRAVEGRPFGEIASILGCTETAARGVEARAKRALRSIVLEEIRDATA